MTYDYLVETGMVLFFRCGMVGRGQVWQMFNTYCCSIQTSVETTDLEFRLMVNMQTKGNEKFSTEKS